MSEPKRVGDCYFTVLNDKVYSNYVEEVCSENMCIVKSTMVMDKETFIKCYEKWIKGENNDK